MKQRAELAIGREKGTRRFEKLRGMRPVSLLLKMSYPDPLIGSFRNKHPHLVWGIGIGMGKWV
jgi:hypothetical protein